MSWIVSIEFTAKRDWTALHHAANDQNIDELRRLLNNNVDDAVIDVDDANNPKHETPLMLAASTGNEHVIRLLLDHRANIDKLWRYK